MCNLQPTLFFLHNERQCLRSIEKRFFLSKNNKTNLSVFFEAREARFGMENFFEKANVISWKSWSSLILAARRRPFLFFSVRARGWIKKSPTHFWSRPQINWRSADQLSKVDLSRFRQWEISRFRTISFWVGLALFFSSSEQ